MKHIGYDAIPFCAECGGCCQSCPGTLYPSDLTAVTVDEIARLLETGNYAVDHWAKSDSRLRRILRFLTANRIPQLASRMRLILYLRPRSKDGSIVVPFSEPGGECIFLSESGCVLPLAQRPRGCRMLEPKPGDENCDPHGHTKEHGYKAWRPYQEKVRGAMIRLDLQEPKPPTFREGMDLVGRIAAEMLAGATGLESIKPELSEEHPGWWKISPVLGGRRIRTMPGIADEYVLIQAYIPEDNEQTHD